MSLISKIFSYTVKNIFIVTLVLGFNFISYGQNRYPIEETTLSLDEYGFVYLKKDSALVTGIIYREYKNGRMKMERNYKEGVLSGLFRNWYKNGQLKIERNYSNNESVGLVKNWYKNGQLEAEINYPFYREWYKNGQLKYELDADDELQVKSEDCWDKKGNKIECK